MSEADSDTTVASDESRRSSTADGNGGGISGPYNADGNGGGISGPYNADGNGGGISGP
jgi:hypothetical protein